MTGAGCIAPRAERAAAVARVPRRSTAHAACASALGDPLDDDDSCVAPGRHTAQRRQKNLRRACCLLVARVQKGCTPMITMQTHTRAYAQLRIPRRQTRRPKQNPKPARHLALVANSTVCALYKIALSFYPAPIPGSYISAADLIIIHHSRAHCHAASTLAPPRLVSPLSSRHTVGIEAPRRVEVRHMILQRPMWEDVRG